MRSDRAELTHDTTASPGTRGADSMRRWLAGALSWAYATRIDLAIVTSITALAAAIRLWHLGTVPLGLHGDEALTGIDARRILHEGWIGPYVTSALGQPTGPLYLAAALFKVMPETTFTIRFSMALFGIASIPLAYLAFATMFNRSVAAFATLLLSVMTWHLHLSRTGFMVISWPFIEMLVLLVLFVALRRRSAILLVVAGALAGLGVYSYNAYLLFVPVLLVPFVWLVAASRDRDERLWLVGGFVMFAATALLVTLPMINYVHNHGDDYRFHERAVSVTNSTDWKDASVGGKARLLLDRTREWERGMVEGGRPDLGDGLAAGGHPVVDAVTVFLAVIGLAFAMSQARKPEYATVLAACVLLPSGAILTIEDGLFRRTVGLAPFVAVLAAFPLAWAWEQAIRSSARWRFAVPAVIAVALAFTVVHNVYDYFGPAQDTEAVRFVYPYQEDAAAHYIAGLPASTLIYFYSDRWSVNYETRLFIAPNAEGVDRSREFRNFPFADDGAPLNFDADRTRDVAFVFLGDYLDNIDDVTRLYRTGTLTEGDRGDETTFRAYFVPAEAPQ